MKSNTIENSFHITEKIYKASTSISSRLSIGYIDSSDALFNITLNEGLDALFKHLKYDRYGEIWMKIGPVLTLEGKQYVVDGISIGHELESGIWIMIYVSDWSGKMIVQKILDKFL